MRNELNPAADLLPLEGESLNAFINRNRPESAPEIPDTLPRFDPVQGFCWQVAGWTVAAEIDEAGGVAVHWHAPDGSEVVGYSLNHDGRRCALDDGTGNSVWLPYWPAIAAA